ncbi:MAG: hypothetical protein ACRBCS_05120 [Cellvibrionaceae bacterium]
MIFLKLKHSFFHIHKLRLATNVSLFFTLVFAQNIYADITSLCAATDPCSYSGEITTGVPGNLSVTWQGSILNLSASNAPTEPVNSNGGTFYVIQNNQEIPVGNTFTLLSQNVTYVVGSQLPNLFSFTENLSVPANVSLAAANLGATQLVYRRQFTSPFSNSNASIVFPLKPMPPNLGGVTTPPTTPPTNGNNNILTSALDIQRIALRFDDDSISRILRRDDKLRAFAEFTYSNGGMLAGVWEVATPARTQGEPIYFPLENVRLYLNPARNKLLESPALPTDSTGLYLLRFRALEPQLSQDTLQLQYFVTEQSQAMRKKIQPLRSSRPTDGAWLKPLTTFRWSSVLNARAYRVEIFQSAAKPASYAEQYSRLDSELGVNPNNISLLDNSMSAVTGLLIPGNQTEAIFSLVSFSHLDKSSHYVWRVIAIDAFGEIIAESSLKNIYTQ